MKHYDTLFKSTNAPLVFKSADSLRTLFAYNADVLWNGEALAVVREIAESESPMGERYELRYLYPDGTPSVPLFCNEIDAAVRYIEGHYHDMLSGVMTRRDTDEYIAQLMAEAERKPHVDRFGCYDDEYIEKGGDL